MKRAYLQHQVLILLAAHPPGGLVAAAAARGVGQRRVFIHPHDAAADLGFGRIVASEIELPNTFVNMVQSG